MSDLISRDALLEAISNTWEESNSLSIINLIANAPAIEQGELVKKAVVDVLEELERALCLIGVVGNVDGHDVIRRDSVINVARQRIKRDANDVFKYPPYSFPKQIPDGWKPIETAPKDGTQVIIKCSGGRVATAFYDDKPFVGEGWHVVVPFLGGFGSGTDTFIYFPEDMPTHWMPLPEAPTTSETNTEVGE